MVILAFIKKIDFDYNGKKIPDFSSSSTESLKGLLGTIDKDMEEIRQKETEALDRWIVDWKKALQDEIEKKEREEE